MIAHPNTLLGKLRSPRVNVKALSRARLFKQLDNSMAHDLTLVVAPAGFGKTMLLTTWVAQGKLPTAWLSLDASNHDFSTFVRDLAQSIEVLYSDACRATLSLVNALRATNSAQLTNSLLAEIGDLPGKLILVLDDYHVVKNPLADALILSVIDNHSQHLHLVISSRTEPPLPLARWRLAGRLNEIRIGDIRFDMSEARALLTLFLQVDVPATISDAIVARTDGWAAGLRLAALSLEGQLDLSELSGDWLGHNRFIMDYLMDEVFAYQTPAVQALLLKSSILEWMSEPLLTAILGANPDSSDEASLSQLLASGLFVEAVNRSEGMYRYHDLFRELLRQRLAARYTARDIAALHSAASTWFTTQGLLEDAVRHALAAGEPLAAVHAVEANIHPLLNREEKRRLELLLDMLPPGLTEERAPLLIARAWIMHFESRYGAYAPLLAKAEQLLLRPGQVPVEEAPAWCGNIAALRGQLLFWQSRCGEALEQASEAIRTIPATQELARGNALLFAGLSQHATGQGAAAIQFFRDNLGSTHGQSAKWNMRVLLGLCSAYLDSGNIEQLQQTASIMLRQATAANLSISRAWAHLFMGRASYEWNDLDTAQYHFLAGAALRKAANAVSAHDCLSGLALIDAAQGHWQRANETAAILVEFDSDPPAFALLKHAYSLRARLALDSGNLDSALPWMLSNEMERQLVPTPLCEASIVTHGRVLLALKSREGAQQAFDLGSQLQQNAMAIASPLRLVQALIIQALALDALDERRRALEVLNNAVGMAYSGGLVRTFVDFGATLGDLLSQLPKSGLVTHQGTASYLLRLLAGFPVAPAASAARNAPLPRDGMLEALTRREFEVLELLARRLTDREIADILVISPFTVRRHVENLSDKLGAHGRRALVERARSLELLAPPSA